MACFPDCCAAADVARRCTFGTGEKGERTRAICVQETTKMAECIASVLAGRRWNEKLEEVAQVQKTLEEIANQRHTLTAEQKQQLQSDKRRTAKLPEWQPDSLNKPSKMRYWCMARHVLT